MTGQISMDANAYSACYINDVANRCYLDGGVGIGGASRAISSGAFTCFLTFGRCVIGNLTLEKAVEITMHQLSDHDHFCCKSTVASHARKNIL